MVFVRPRINVHSGHWAPKITSSSRYLVVGSWYQGRVLHIVSKEEPLPCCICHTVVYGPMFPASAYAIRKQWPPLILCYGIVTTTTSNPLTHTVQAASSTPKRKGSDQSAKSHCVPQKALHVNLTCNLGNLYTRGPHRVPSLVTSHCVHISTHSISREQGSQIWYSFKSITPYQ